MDEPVRFAGKVDGWFHALAVGVNVLFAWTVALSFAKLGQGGGIIDVVAGVSVLALSDLLIIPMIVRNYVEFDGEGGLVIVFGFQKMSFPVAKVRHVRETRNPLASLAASLDRIELKAGYEEVMIAVRDKEGLYRELRRRNPGVTIERRGS